MEIYYVKQSRVHYRYCYGILVVVILYVPSFLHARMSYAGDFCEDQFELLHPALHLTNVQRMCIEVGADLDVASSTPEVQKIWGEQTDYLIDQFLKLYTSVANLISNKKEARSYLKEDALFLIELLEVIYQKYQRFSLSNPDINRHVLSCLTILMEKSRQKIHDVLKLNQEYLLSERCNNF